MVNRMDGNYLYMLCNERSIAMIERIVIGITAVIMLGVLVGITFDWFVSKKIEELEDKKKKKSNYKNKRK